MGKIIYILYNIFFLPLFISGFRTGALFNAKIREGATGRKKQKQLLKTKSFNIPDHRTRILFHCTSVGEWEQAAPILEELKKDNPGIFTMVSFFSPSGYHFVKQHPGIDLKVYLPLDHRHKMKRFLSFMKPDLIVISKFDVWPNFLVLAHRMNIPVVLTAATLSADSGRDKGISKILNQFVYKHFDFIFPISGDDLQRFLLLYPFPEKMLVTGDTRFDQVYRKGKKAMEAENVPVFLNPADNDWIFIAGSIWPADEKHLFPALIEVMQRYPNVRVILVPHELQETHLSSIEQTFIKAGLETERYTNFQTKQGTEKRVAIIDTIGMLARLYKQSKAAYVGGSFDSGVHNVMEPSVFGQPVIFGPRHLNSYEALQLIKAGSAFCVRNAEEIKSRITDFVRNECFRDNSGMAAIELMEANLGATEKIVNHLMKRYDFISQKDTD